MRKNKPGRPPNDERREAIVALRDKLNWSWGQIGKALEIHPTTVAKTYYRTKGSTNYPQGDV